MLVADSPNRKGRMGGGLTLAGVDPNHRSHFIWEEPAGEYPGGQGLSKLSMDV